MDLTLHKGHRVVKSISNIDIYYQDLIPTNNFCSISVPIDTTISNGNILISTIPTGIDIFNGNTGIIGTLDIVTSGFISITSLNFESNLRRTFLSISGAKIIMGGV